MRKIYLFDNTYKKDSAKFWEDVTYMNNSIITRISIPKSRIKQIDNNFIELSKKYDLTIYEEFKNGLNEFEEDSFIMNFKILCTSKNIFHGNPKTNIYSLPKDIILFLLQDSHQLLKLNNNYLNNVDIILNIVKSSENSCIIPFKSYLIINEMQSITYLHKDIEYSLEKIIIKDPLLKKIMSDSN